MADLFVTLIQGATAFAATNLDDIVILMLFFAQVGTVFRHRQIVAGQYLGFAALVVMSLPGFFGGCLLPRPWIGLLGVVPIAIGLSQLLAVEAEADNDLAPNGEVESSAAGWCGLLSPQTTSVAAITMANGGDNVGIYMPPFASSDGWRLGITLAVFFGLVGVWCLVAYRLARLGAIAPLLTQYGRQVVPFVLMALGGLILVDSHTLEYRGLTALALTIVGICLLRLLHTATQLSRALPAAAVRSLSTVEKMEG